MPSHHAISRAKHGLIALTNHLNTTNLTIPYCNQADPGHQPTLIDCTRAINTIRFSPAAFNFRVWTAVDAIHFKASSESCQVLIVSSLRDSLDIFAMIDVADTAVDIMTACYQARTSTTLGGRDVVGPKAEFQVIVAYVEPNQNDERPRRM